MTAYRCTGEHSVRPYAHGFVGAILVIAHHNTQTPITTLETRGHLGEASLTPTVSRGRYGFIG